MSDLSSGLRPAILTYGLDRPPTGIGRYSIELITALSELGVAPALVGNPAPFLPGSQGHSYYSLPGARLLPGLLTLGNLAVRLIIPRTGLKIVHDPTGSAPFLFGAGRAKTIVTVHDMFALAYPGTGTLIEALLTRFWLPLVLPHVDAVITVSQWSKNDIMRFTRVPESKIHVIPNGQSGFLPADEPGTQTALERYGLAPGYILSVSSFEPRRNLPRLLHAYARLYHQGDHRRLVLVGNPRLKKKDLLELVQKLGLQQQIVFPGYVSASDLKILYRNAALFVFPSLYEGFGLPPLEAMACGTPVVCANSTSLPEVVGDAALLVDPYDVDAIAGGMSRVLADPALRDDLRRRGLARAAIFTWQRTARETLDVYRQVVS